MAKLNFPKVEIVKKRKGANPAGTNHYVTINGVRVPYVKSITMGMDARSLPTVTITMYAEISHKTLRRPL